MRAGLISLLIGSFLIILIVTLFLTRALPKFSLGNGSSVGGGTPGQLVKQTSDVKIQVDLKSAETSIVSFYSERGRYPDSAAELTSFGSTIPNGIVYIKCIENMVIFYSNTNSYPGIQLENGVSSRISNKTSC